MKKLAFTLLAALMISPIHAAESSNEGEDKLKWYNGAELEKAKKEATEKEKQIFLEFTGSDWCPPCFQLKKDVFSKKEFAEYADKHLVLVKVDFPRRKQLPKEVQEANQKLSQKYSVQGLPTIVMITPDDKELGTSMGYAGTGLEAFLKKLDEFRKKASS